MIFVQPFNLLKEKINLSTLVYSTMDLIIFCQENYINIDLDKLSLFLSDLDNVFYAKDFSDYCNSMLKYIDFDEEFKEDAYTILYYAFNVNCTDDYHDLISIQSVNLFYNYLWPLIIKALILYLTEVENNLETLDIITLQFVIEANDISSFYKELSIDNNDIYSLFIHDLILLLTFHNFGLSLMQIIQSGDIEFSLMI